VWSHRAKGGVSDGYVCYGGDVENTITHLQLEGGERVSTGLEDSILLQLIQLSCTGTHKHTHMNTQTYTCEHTKTHMLTHTCEHTNIHM